MRHYYSIYHAKNIERICGVTEIKRKAAAIEKPEFSIMA